MLRVQTVGYIKLVDSLNRTFAIYAKDNKVYLPLNLDEKFKRDGINVLFEGTIDTIGLKNVRLAGLPITLEKIREK